VAVTAKLMPGAPVSEATFADLEPRIKHLIDQGHTPGLATILVGDDGASAGYIRMKQEKAAEVGMTSPHIHLPADAQQSDLVAAVRAFNDDPTVDAMLVQHPAPPQIDYEAALLEMDPDKDVDGLHPVNLGRLVLNQDGPLPCTPHGMVVLLREYGIPIAGAEAVVIGRGITVGRTMGLLLTRKSENATVTLCHTGTKDLAAHTRQADIVIVAAGVPGLLTADMVKPGAAVLDVGITRTDAGLVGDVAPDVASVAGWVAPNPGGVGPMTRAMLLANVVETAERAVNA
jgi:methylenetetrahydrofolate dehydrogenase (NADP+)/methenyltetrahydrofolate cyclohydrolase